MARYDDIDPQDIDPETNAPYPGYSSPALDTSFHDHEMDVEDKCSHGRLITEECRQCEDDVALRMGVQPQVDEEDPDACTNRRGHKWAYTGTQYGGDDERWHGEGRCYCEYCGADGDA